MSNGALDAVTESVRTRYGTVSFFSTDNVIGRSLREYGEWAQNEIELFLKYLRPGDTVLDIGAFIGTHTLAFSKIVGEKGNIYSFEPQPIVFKLLDKNIARNMLKNVRVFNIAISDVDKGAFARSFSPEMNHNLGASSLSQILSEEERRPIDAEAINIRRIDTLGILSCDFIKIDVEGMELNVLNGANELIDKSRPLIYLVVFFR